MKEPADFDRCADRLKALADPERLKIVTVLLNGPRLVGAICEELDEPIVKVSHHLGVLRNANLVTATKQGRNVEYALHPDVFLVADASEPDQQLDLGCCCLELSAKRNEKRKMPRKS
jgi:DNA-binding transcriptional ArsR family regulator